MITMDRYIDTVLGNIYAPADKRAHFEAWLRLQVNHLRKKGFANNEIMQALGEPDVLAVEMMKDDVTTRLRFAGFFRRFPALVVDILLLTAVTALPFAFAVNVIDGGNPPPPLVFVAVTTIFAILAFYPTFFILMEGTRGRTPGKRLLGLRVVRTNGDPITMKDAFLRTIVLISPLLPFDLITGLVSKRRQRLADLIADTVVVREVRVKTRRS
ncbi:MAG: RDD family protein [Acidobacteriota bacterium]|nr:RDD family protein [Acidobacteriota bacterium]